MEQRSQYVLMCLGLLFLNACGQFSTSYSTLTPASSMTKAVPGKNLAPWRHTVVSAAQSVLGTPYRFGGIDSNGMDCSGLVYFSFANAGKTVPRTVEELFNTSLAVQNTQLLPGDLVFFRINDNIVQINHVGIYIGQGQFIHAPKTGKQVLITTLATPYWRDRFIRGGRLNIFIHDTII